MRALQLTKWHSDPVVVNVDAPIAGAGQVVVKIGAAGLCHSDLHLMRDFDEGMFAWEPPFTLGHENTGWLHELGEGVEGWEVGEAVAVHGPWGCGVCAQCAAGADSYCYHPTKAYGSAYGGGLGADGGLAEFMLVPSARHLVRIPMGLSVVDAAPLTDAGLTPYHAIKMSLAKLVPGSTVAIIGVGGLGHVAVQILRAITGATIVAMDIRDEALELARSVGADHTIRADAPDVAAQVKAIADGVGADVVIDFVGNDATLATSVACTRPRGDMTIVGGAGGTFAMGQYTVPYELVVRNMYWGSRAELGEVLALGAKQKIQAHYTTYSLENAMDGYRAIEAGTLLGRGVVVP